MKVSDQLIEQIKQFEGFRENAYICPAGIKTIGYGHVLADNDNRKKIASSEAEELLMQDIKKVELSIERNIKVGLTQGQFDALVSFTFNVGSASLQRSTIRQKVNRQEHEDVPPEIKRWIFAGGRILSGLVNRREIEANMYRS